MEQSYHATITVNTDMAAAFESVQKRVKEWWTANFTGSSEQAGDEFTTTFGTTWVALKVTELQPGKQIVWLVTDSHLPWLHEKEEWTGTSMIWTFTHVDDAAVISFTHAGLVPEVECYDNCTKGWDFYIKRSLYRLLTENKGMPDTPVSAR